RIAAKLPGRTNKDCRKRWHNSVAGGLKKGQWSKSEDVQLARGVQQYGQRWTLVANIVGSRSADQCAKRWQQSLDPDLDRSEWCDVEDKVLIEAVRRLGRHWKDIQRHHFAGRSKNCIKNRYGCLPMFRSTKLTLKATPSSSGDIKTKASRCRHQQPAQNQARPTLPQTMTTCLIHPVYRMTFRILIPRFLHRRRTIHGLPTWSITPAGHRRIPSTPLPLLQVSHTPNNHRLQTPLIVRNGTGLQHR
ncbi:hypothetical protein K458DRAFT_303512, partial [Lentithecium fluviatile CBS 122367]